MTRPFLSLSLAVVLASAGAAQPAAPQDVVHEQVQKFLDVLRSGGDFANSEFREAVKPADVARLTGLAQCDLDSVKRSTGGSSAIVLFSCPAAGGKASTAVMMMFSSGTVVSIHPMSFVGVPERG
jgi:hypothetical protein